MTLCLGKSRGDCEVVTHEPAQLSSWGRGTRLKLIPGIDH